MLFVIEEAKKLFWIFQNKLLPSNTQVSSLRKAFENDSTAGIIFSKTQLSKMVQFGRFLGKLLGSLTKTGLLLIRNVLKTIAKCVLVPLGLSAVASATCCYSKENVRVEDDCTDNLKWRNEWYYENS